MVRGPSPFLFSFLSISVVAGRGKKKGDKGSLSLLPSPPLPSSPSGFLSDGRAEQGKSGIVTHVDFLFLLPFSPLPLFPSVGSRDRRVLFLLFPRSRAKEGSGQGRLPLPSFPFFPVIKKDRQGRGVGFFFFLPTGCSSPLRQQTWRLLLPFFFSPGSRNVARGALFSKSTIRCGAPSSLLPFSFPPLRLTST